MILRYMRRKREEKTRKDAESTWHSQLTEAADFAITFRPRVSPDGIDPVTPEDMQREAWSRFRLEVSTEDAREVLARRLRYRGFSPEYFLTESR